MKPDTNLSQRSSIFYCNRHQIDRTSKINFCATTQKFRGKEQAALFFEWAFWSCGRHRNHKKRITIPLHVSKMGEKTRHQFYYIDFEITGDPCNLIGSYRCDLFTKSTFFSLNCIFLPPNDIEKRLLQPFEDQLTAGSKKHFYRLKRPVSEGLNFAISKWT